MKLEKLQILLQRSWDKDTSHYKDWKPANPAYGQCAVTALVVQDYLGGDIISCFVGKFRHYYNDTHDKNEIDLTASQYDPFVPYYEQCKIVDRKQLLLNLDVNGIKLCRNWKSKFLKQTLRFELILNY